MAEVTSVDAASTTPLGEEVLTIVAVGGSAFRAITGLRHSIEDCRGYLFGPDDCRPVVRRVRGVVGTYRTKRRRPDGSMGAVGDPKYGMVKVEERFPLPPNLRWIIPVLDPVSVQKSGLRTVVALKADLARAATFGAPHSTYSPLHISFLPLPVAFGVEGVPAAIDIETAGDAIQRMGVSDGKCTWTAPWDWRAAGLVRRLFGEGRVIVGHNLNFDLHFLRREGLEPTGPLFDTMMAAHLLQPDLYKGLGRAASLYLDLKMWKHESSEKPEYYNAADVKITHHLMQREQELLVETGQDRLFHETLMPALPVLMRMSERGIRVDSGFLETWTAQLGAQRRDLLSKWMGLAPGVNPNSPAQVGKLLGMGSVDETNLRQSRARHPELIDTLLELRKVAKMIGTYTTSEIGGDGCVHPHYLPAGKESDVGAAATGRLASSSPNIQNQPKDARRLFIARRPDLALLEVDYSQIELRIAAFLANDLALIDALKGDVHARTQETLRCDRVRAKNVIYGSLYGAGPRKLAILLRTRGIQTNESECRSLQDALAKAYPDLWRWRLDVAAEGTARRFLTNGFGRRRYFYGGSSQTPQMIDYLPQSTAADIVWDRLRPLDEFCTAHGGALLATVHDSFLMEFPKQEMGECLYGGLRELLEIEYPNVAPNLRVPVDMKTGANWGEMSPINN